MVSPQTFDKCNNNYVLDTAVNFGHLALEITDVLLEALFLFHLDGKEWWKFFLNSLHKAK